MSVRFHPALDHLLEPIERVTQHPDNPNDGDVEAVAESMQVNGVYGPVFAQKSTGRIVADNTRYAALLSLGSTTIPVVWLEIDDTMALRILYADNQTARLAHMDSRAMEAGLSILAASEVGLLGTGYPDGILARLAEINNEDVSALAEDWDDGVRQNARAITCPSCGHQFGGGR